MTTSPQQSPQPADGAAPAPQSGGATAAAGSRSGSAGDSFVAKLLVERGLATQAEVESCLQASRATAAAPLPQTFLQVLLERKIVTITQLQRVRASLKPGHTVPKIRGFELMHVLGKGAMGEVWLAKQISLQRLVAIKMLPPAFCTDARFVERFYREGRAAGRLSDPNIVAAYDVGEWSEGHYFVMEYVDGETIDDVIRRKRQMGEAESVTIIRQTASALAHAHARGIIHRDVKPKNIMINKAGAVKLADLGLARAMDDNAARTEEQGKAFGTPFYISPEQIRASPDVGPAADIYGLGATLYHMVTGRPPFQGANSRQVMQMHLSSALVPPDHVNPTISPGLAEVIEMMLTKRPADRYHDTTQLIEDLDRLSRSEPPYHARRGVDISKLASEIEVGAQTTPVHRGESGLMGVGVSTLMTVLLVISLLGNIALAIALLRR